MIESTVQAYRLMGALDCRNGRSPSSGKPNVYYEGFEQEKVKQDKLEKEQNERN